jgi:hypothetical protein
VRATFAAPERVVRFAFGPASHGDGQAENEEREPEEREHHEHVAGYGEPIPRVATAACASGCNSGRIACSQIQRNTTISGDSCGFAALVAGSVR